MTLGKTVLPERLYIMRHIPIKTVEINLPSCFVVILLFLEK
jgi:hypothetical protein